MKAQASDSLIRFDIGGPDSPSTLFFRSDGSGRIACFGDQWQTDIDVPTGVRSIPRMGAAGEPLNSSRTEAVQEDDPDFALLAHARQWLTDACEVHPQ